MNAVWKGEDRRSGGPGALLPMTAAQLDAVMAIEVAAYAFPWTRGNFIDSLVGGYAARVLCAGTQGLLGYFVAMAGAGEMHLLNITVAPAARGRGHARILFDELLCLCRQQQARELWLEVRESNAHARAVYLHLGFAHAGMRKGYYPAARGRREDAAVMSLRLEPSPAEAPDALD